MLRLTCIILSFSYISLFSQGGNPLFIEIASGLRDPVVITNAGDNSNRLFIVEQAGRIEVLNMSSLEIEPSPFLDIRSRVNDNGNEEGLLGLAFHPDYATNGFFFVYYIFSANPSRTRISRFTVSSSDPNTADPNSELILMEFSQPYTNHNGGDLQFGPDGYLYIASGDGGDSFDPDGNGQNTSTLLGAILRIDVDNASGNLNYSIPADNPFGNEIWLHGLRNPWRFSFDSDNGDMYIADVGQNAREEVSVVKSDTIPISGQGINLGWDCREGFIGSSGCSGNFLDPIFDYVHNFNTGGYSITGGFVYRGETFEDFKGWYFFADYISDRLWQTKGTSATGLQVQTKFVTNVNNISSFGVSQAGELYAVSHGFNGKVYRIIDQDDCPQSLSLPFIASGTYRAREFIRSRATVPANSDVRYGAPEVLLEEDFAVPEATLFETLIGICGSW